MTSSADAALQLAKALSPSKQQLSVLKDYADFCGTPANVVSSLTRLELDMSMLFNRTKELLNGFLQTIQKLDSPTAKQHTLYCELMVFFNTIDLYGSCLQDPAKMLQWVRGFSALWIVSQAMSENGIKSGVFGGNEGFFHFGRPAWSGESNKFGNVLASMNLLIQKMAKWGGVEKGKNQEVDDLLFEARLANLREDPVELRGIDRLVQAFADEAARNFLDKLPPAGSKNCRGA